MKGVFGLANARDLLEKLRHDYGLLKNDPDNPYIAFNFFVTAEHLPDWLYPKKAQRNKRESLRASNILFQICSHLANGAKHFEVEAKHHQSITDTSHVGGTFGANTFKARTFAASSFPKNKIVVHLKADARKALGDSIGAVQLAGRLLTLWEGELPRHESHP